jgi:hypothetical protein
MLPKNAIQEFDCKTDWEGKPIKALCAECERVIHAGNSEEHARRKAREHEKTMKKYADPESCDDPEHARLLNPQETEHTTGIRQDR